MENVDQICHRIQRVSTYLFLIQNLYRFLCTILSSTFLLFQFLILFHYIIHCENVLIRTNFVPI
jgi:hypothetical protein